MVPGSLLLLTGEESNLKPKLVCWPAMPQHHIPGIHTSSGLLIPALSYCVASGTWHDTFYPTPGCWIHLITFTANLIQHFIHILSHTHMDGLVVGKKQAAVLVFVSLKLSSICESVVNTLYM